MIYLLFFTQLINYVLAALSPAIFCSALYLALVSLFDVESTTILAIVIIYGVYLVFFVWVHRFIAFVKPMFYLIVVINAVGMCIIIAGYVKQAIKFDFSPLGDDHLIIQWATIGIISIPFVMALIALDLKSFGIEEKARGYTAGVNSMYICASHFLPPELDSIEYPFCVSIWTA